MAANYVARQAGSSLVRASMKTSVLAWTMCGFGALFYCYEYFLRISPSVMTPELMSSYHLTGAQIGGLSAFYYHAYVPMQILVGLLMDRYGPRRLLSVACLLCAIGTYLFASNHGIGVAELGRFLVGLGSAFAFVGAAKLATIWLPPNRFALISGIILCLGMLGAMLGDILLRWLVDAIGWRITLFGSASAGLFLAFLIWLCVRDKNPYHVDHFTHAPATLKSVLSGLLLAVRNSQIWLNGLIGLLLYLSLSAFAELWGVPYLQQAHSLSRINAADANSMIFLGWAVGGPFWGWFSDFVRLRCTPMMLASFGALLSVCVILYFPTLISLPLLFILLFVFGFFSSVQILVFALSREATPIKIAGTTIGLLNMLVMLGGNILQPLIGKLLDLQWTGLLHDGARVYTSSAYTYALSVLPVSIIMAMVIISFVRETHCQIHVDDVIH